MVLNYLEMGQIAAMFAAILALFALVVYLEGKNWFARKEAALRVEAGEQLVVLKAEAGNWAGAAIGRFWQTLSEKAAEDVDGSSSGPATGAINLGGFKIDADTIKSIMELVKVAQSFGFLKGLGGTGETANPFLK